MHQERKRYHSSSTLASVSEPGGCYGEIIKYLAHLARKAKRKLNRYFKRAQGRRQRRVKPDLEQAISLTRKRKVRTTPKYAYPHQSDTKCNYVKADSSPLAPRASPEVSDIDPLSSPRRPILLTVPSDISVNPLTDSLVSHSPDTLAPPIVTDTHQNESSNHGCHSDRPSQQSSQVSPVSSNAGSSLGRRPSCHSNGGNGKVVTIATPDMLSVPNDKLVKSKSLLSADYEPVKSQIYADTDDKGNVIIGAAQNFDYELHLIVVVSVYSYKYIQDIRFFSRLYYVYV